MATNALREVLRAAESLADLDFDYPTANYFGPTNRLEAFLDAAVAQDEGGDGADDEPVKVALPRALREVTVP